MTSQCKVTQCKVFETPVEVIAETVRLHLRKGNETKTTARYIGLKEIEVTGMLGDVQSTELCGACDEVLDT